MKLLGDFFCGAGGCTKGFQRSGFRVVGIDIHPQPNYCGENFIQMDAPEALEILLSGEALPCAGGWFELGDFAGFSASPPCQFYAPQGGEGHWRSIPPTRELLERTGLPYVIENVASAAWDMREPIQLCGSSFGLGVRRHRLFESNVPMMALPCQHGQQRPRYRVFQRGRWYLSSVAHVWGVGGGKAKDEWPEAMGIDWMSSAELREAIPPAMTEFVGTQLLAHIEFERKQAA